MKNLYTILLIFIYTILQSQPTPTIATEVINGLALKEDLLQSSMVKQLPFRSIGPTVMSGRVVDIAVNPANPTEFYVGYASGGVWHTTNNGTSFEPILDSSPTQNVGALAVDWKNRTIWVGTGEVNASRSSYAGIGLLQSNDNGKTWSTMGLQDSHHISKILINPNNTNEIVVGVIGHLYSKNQERGVFKSFDGGKTWNKTLFINDETGIIEMDVHPNNYNIMFASSWQKDRKAWNFKGNGVASAIYKSTDAGNTWTLMTTKESGFPTGDGVGRIGVAVVDENTLYAIHDSQFLRPKEKEELETGLTKENFKIMSKADFSSLEDQKLEDYLRGNGFPKKYTATSVKKMIKDGIAQPLDLTKYLEDANTLLFDTPVEGAEVYKSTNGGKKWKKTHEGYLDGIYYSYGYYFGKIHVDPNNENGIYIYGVPILKSKDGGKTFTSIDASNVHADHHALWINPKMPGHLINGNDGGVNISYDDGENWIKCNTPAVGQFYAINLDNAEPYNVYGGLQDNGVWVGSHETEEGVYWHQSGKYPYEMIMGGDGMQIQIDSRNNNIVYTGFQFGNYFRLNRETNEQTYIQPKHELGENPYRFNWQTPILLSNHNQDILYYAGNKLMRSFNKGDDWQAISPDLTNGGKKGNVAYGTISSISESPLQFGLLYTGSDDGLVYVSKNGGGDWDRISSTFPKDLWVSRVIASQHKKSRVYVALNGYRWDDFKPYVYKSDDYGTSWKTISSNLPTSPVNVIREDPSNDQILYLGTDNGVYVSFNQGASWEVFNGGLPNVAAHDLVVHPEAKDLVVGTHGRSIYIADISLLQQLSEEKMSDLFINTIEPIRASRRWGSSFSSWSEVFEPSTNIQIYSPSEGKISLTILDENGTILNEWKEDAVKGINIFSYNLSISGKEKKTLEKLGVKLTKAENNTYYLPKGKYTISALLKGNTAKQELEIK